MFSRRVGWALATPHRPAAGGARDGAVGPLPPDRRAGAPTDAGSQYLAICYTATLAVVGAVPSVGTVGDSYDNVRTASMIRQLKAELIHQRSPWRTVAQLEFALFEYIDWWNHRWLHAEIGTHTSAEAEAAYYPQPRSTTEATSQ